VTFGTTASRQTYAGFFLITLSTLMYEILLTRIFSVSMWYHFAFIAISIAMFGMTVGAIIVYLLPSVFVRESVKRHMTVNAVLFTVSIIICTLVHIYVPFNPSKTLVGFWSMAVTYSVVSVPFVFSGICVCLALTRFPLQISKLYAADLAGAAVGCIFLIYIMKITDGPTAAFAIACFTGFGTILFARDCQNVKLTRISTTLTILIAIFTIAHTFLVWYQKPIIRMTRVKGQHETQTVYEKWNSFSRVLVFGDSNKLREPMGWGLSPALKSDRKVRFLYLNIDAAAGTDMMGFDYDLKNIEFLKYDITNLAHYLRKDANVGIIGVGGGKDVLAALAFKQKSIIGIEINEDILNIVNNRFGDFTGHLDRNPSVTFINDEARSYITRQKDTFDILQVSLIDTWAATAAGAFVLTENALYTVEAWKIFLENLTSDGILTFSRWYFKKQPGEMYRLASLATATLKQAGIQNPREHIIIARYMQDQMKGIPDGVGTILVSKKPFTARETDLMEKTITDLRFDLILSPNSSSDQIFTKIVSSGDNREFIDSFPLNIVAPTDNSPFFFNMLKFSNIFNGSSLSQGMSYRNQEAVYILGILLLVVFLLTTLCIIVPLVLTSRFAQLQGSFPLFVFFLTIGLGYMLIEISQMQRLIVFLGHPTYGLSVVLFVFLLSSGFGSYSTWKIDVLSSRSRAMFRLFLLLCVLVLFGITTSFAVPIFRGSSTFIRIAAAVVILFPLGFFMGMAFPLGMKLASDRSPALTPWLWGINGSASVCASVVAVVIALTAGISASFWCGSICYLISFFAFLAATYKTS